jgi:serine phosphatase RsbU (regulator of sigma subunit)
VSGKGAEAAAVTALARYTLRAAALEDAPPSGALKRLNTAMLYDDTSQFATVVIAYLSAGPAGSIDLRLALAGHPPPAVVRRDGRVEMVGQYGTMAGLRPDIAVHDVEIRLEADEVLLLYTDGVTEVRRRRQEVFGHRALVSLLEKCAGLPPDAVADRVEAAVMTASEGRLRDDVAILAFGPTPQPKEIDG